MSFEYHNAKPQPHAQATDILPQIHEKTPPPPAVVAPQLRYCIYCQNQKIWRFRGDKAKDGSKIYVDHRGSRWAGKRCPDCEKKRVRAANKHDQFERTSIAQKLKASGYEVVSTASPMLVKKGDEYLTVGIRRAFTHESGTIVVEKPTEASEKTHLTALLFQTTKILPHDKLTAMEHQFETFTSRPAAGKTPAPTCHPPAPGASPDPMKKSS